MVAKNDLLTAMQSIEGALSRFAGDVPNARVRVLETPHGHVWALVGSSQFKDLSVGRRQKRIWNFLRNNVGPEHLSVLYGIYALDEHEFDDAMREARLRAIEEWDVDH